MTVKDRLVRATTDSMRRRGVAGASLSEILATSGAARRSIYLNFPQGKAEMVTEATREAGATIAAVIDRIPDGDDPIGAFTAMWIGILTSTDFDAGCPVVAAALGRADAQDAADLAGEIFTEWHSMVRDRLVADGVDERVAESLAITIVAAIEGAVITAQAQRSTRPVEEVGSRMRELVDLHRV